MAGSHEVRGSIPLCSTINFTRAYTVLVSYCLPEGPHAPGLDVQSFPSRTKVRSAALRANSGHLGTFRLPCRSSCFSVAVFVSMLRNGRAPHLGLHLLPSRTKVRSVGIQANLGHRAVPRLDLLIFRCCR